MKEWNKPQLLTLGVENTFEYETDEISAVDHVCHFTGNQHCNQQIDGPHSDDGSNSGYVHGFTGKPCPDHQGNSSCCCYGVSPQS